MVLQLAATSNLVSRLRNVVSTGRYVVYARQNVDSSGSNLTSSTIFEYDLLSGVSVQVNPTSGPPSVFPATAQFAEEPSVSADGMLIAYQTGTVRAFSKFIPAFSGYGEVYVTNMVTGNTTKISGNTTGGRNSNSDSNPVISADGRFVAYESESGPNGSTQNSVYCRDLLLGTTTLVSESNSGGLSNSDSLAPSISADGRYVAFLSFSTDLVPGGVAGPVAQFVAQKLNVYVRDMVTGTTTFVEQDDAVESPFNYSVLLDHRPSISADGRYIALEMLPSVSENVSVGVYDQVTKTTRIVSSDSAGVLANASSFEPSISPDGRYVTFSSSATNLVPSDPRAATSGNVKSQQQIFVKDLVTGQTTAISASNNGTLGGLPGANKDPLRSFSSASTPSSFLSSIASDGHSVVFESYASNLIDGTATAPGYYSATLPGFAATDSSPIGTGSATGDPHMTTFDGTKYDLSTVGTYTLTQSTADDGLCVQVRTEDLGHVSVYNTAVALVMDAHVVTYDVTSAQHLRIDGVVQPLLVGGSRIDVGAGSLWFTDGAVSCFLASHERITIHDMGVFVDLDVTLDPLRARGSLQGLLGNADGDVGNDVSASGSMVGLTPTADDIAQFASYWAVGAGRSLM